MKHSIKREQSHARMSFAEFENQRSLAEGESNVRATLKHMKLSFHLILTLALWLVAQTATAVELTKTFSFNTATVTNDYLSIKATDPDDNTQKTILTVNGTMMDVYLNSNPAFEIQNVTSAGSGPGNEVQLFISPYVDGKVTKVEFTKAGRSNQQGGSTFSMSIDGMKYNGTDDALTGVGASGESTSFTFISTDAAGIAGNLTMRLGVDAKFFIDKSAGCEMIITYIPNVEPTHSHDFTFNAVGNTLTATCGHSDGLTCSLADAGYTATLTLTPPTESFYRPGTYYSASHNLPAFNTQTGLNGTTDGIRYTPDGTNYTSDAPNAVGDYTARLIVTIGSTNYTLTQSFRVVAYSDIKNIYPQFNISTDDYASTTMAGEGQTVTITFTPKFGETLTSLTVTGATTNYSIGSGITDIGSNTYTFTMPAENVTIGATFSISGDDFAETGTNEYTIKTANGWGWFCFATNYDLAPYGFSGKTVKLATSVGSSEMAGKSGHPFKGTFDGQGNTLTFNLQASEGYSAPFHYTDGATISNLHVEGTIMGGDNTSLGGLVGYAVGNITIENCHVSTQISTTHSGAAWHGGVIAFWYDSNVACTVTGCVYDGLIYNPESSGSTYGCGGFVGCLSQYGHVDLTDCLFIEGQYDNNGGKRELLWGHDNNMNSTFFHRTNYQGEGTLKNCFFVATHFLKQGSPAVESATAPTNFAHFGAPTTDYGFLKVYGHTMVFGGKYYTPIYGDLVEEYDYGGGKSYNIVYDDKPLGIPDITTQLWVPLLRYKRTFTNGKPVTVMMPFNFTKSAFKKSGSSDGLTGHFYEFKGIHLDPQTSKWTAEMGEPDNPETTTMTANTPYLYVPDDEPEYWYIDNGGSGVNIFTQDNGGGNKVTPYDGSNESFRWNKWDFIGTYQPRYWYDGSDSEHPAENIGELGKVYGFAGATKEVQGVYNNTITVQAGEFVRAKNGAKIRPTSCYLMWTGYEPDPDPNAAPARRMTRGAAADEEMPQRITVKLISASGEITGIGTLDTKTGEVSFDSEAWYTLDGTRLSGKPTKKGIYIRSASGKNNGKKVVIK